MSAKQLEVEYCKSEQRVNEMQEFIGVNVMKDDSITDQAVRDRDDCWDAIDKMQRQPRFKQVKTACPGVKRVDPLNAALEQSKRDLEQARRQLNRTP
jgi:hypothetical protein